MNRLGFVVRYAIVLAVGTSALAASAAQAHDPALALRAYGSASVDGMQAPAEWDRAARWDFSANLPGGGTTAATLYAMNDRGYLYLAVAFDRADLPAGSVSFWFNNNHEDPRFEEGDDTLFLSAARFIDGFVTKQPPCPPPYTCVGVADTEVGGIQDGDGVVRTFGTRRLYELRHPLDSADDRHDFSVRFGKRIGFNLFVNLCSSSCVQTTSPDGDVVITSGSTVPPDAEITRGPAQGSFSRREPVEVAFRGVDDEIEPEDLTFECNQDGGEFAPCESPFEFTPDHEGVQTFAVRAIDEAGNVDPTPAVRRWTFDETSPETVRIRGPRRFQRTRVVYRLSATDNVDRPRQLRFRCSLDRSAFRRCPARLVLRVRPGRHVLRVNAIDRTGNVSNRAQVRFVRLKSG